MSRRIALCCRVRAGSRCRMICLRYSVDVRQHDNVDAAVLASPLSGVVSRHRMVLGVPGGGQTPWLKGETLNEEPCHVGGPPGRELPVGGELAGVDGNAVGVSLDADVVRSGAKDRDNGVDAADRARMGAGRTAVIKAGLA